MYNWYEIVKKEWVDDWIKHSKKAKWKMIYLNE